MKYVPSLFIGQLSGSEGSNVASRNRFGSYFRNRVMPVNPMTPSQTVQRNNFMELSADYRTLTEIQRADWRALGDQMVRTGTLGQTYTLTGAQAFLAINRTRRLFAQADVEDAPALEQPGVLTTLVLTAATIGPSLSLAFTPTPIGSGLRLLVFGSAAVSAGKTNVPRGLKRILSAGALDAASPVDLLAAWQALYGTFAAGTKIFVDALVVSENYFQGARMATFDIVA